MAQQDKVSFQFISEPSDINYGGKVHGGMVMKWIDLTAYTCARFWTGTYCVTVYVGGIRFYKSINIGAVIRVDAYVIYTGTTSVHIGVDVYARNFEEDKFEKKTHCVIVFVSVNENGQPQAVPEWIPNTEKEKKLFAYAQTLKKLREHIEKEMQPFLEEA